MSYMKLILSLACIVSVCICLSYAKPTKARYFDSLNQPIKNNFLDILGKRGQRKCESLLGNDVDLKTFNDEVAYAFLTTGNIHGLDELLRYLVDLECFSIEETLTFRYTLIRIYDLLNPHKSQSKSTKQYEKRAMSTEDFYYKLNTLIDEIDFAQKNGNEKSIELMKYLVDYIINLEESGELKKEDANLLLSRIKSIVAKSELKDKSNDEINL